MNAKDESTCRMLAASSVVGMPIRACLEELDTLRKAVKPFAKIVMESEGRIPTERLSFEDWHALGKAAKLEGSNVEVSSGVTNPDKSSLT